MSASSRTQAHEIEAIPENLFREPIDYLYADHFRQRIVCKLLDRIASDLHAKQVDGPAGVVLEYLERDMPLHVEDEEQDLFPCLRAQCKPEDEIEHILTLLTEEHARDQDLGLPLTAGLRCLSEGRPLPNAAEFLKAASTFAETQRRHLAWEEGVVLPLARKKLLPKDLTELGRSMAARRGAAYPE
jgi:hemerythrin-like domain-containing protein